MEIGKNPYYAAALNGLGGILYQKAAYEKAAQVYHEAAAYLLKFLRQDSPSMPLTGSMRLGPCVAWEGSKTPVKPFLEAGIVCKGLYGKENEKVRAVYDELAMIDKELAEHRERATSAPI